MTDYEFRPSTLVYGGNESGKNQYSFLTDERFLEGIVMRSCSDNNVYFSNALLVKVADEGDASEKYKKIQDKVFFDVYAKVCYRRELCPRIDCKRNDAYAAEIVVEKLEQLEGGTFPDNEYISDVMVIEFPESDDAKKEQRKGIRYTCKKTGYTEIACPIRLYDRTMGALIVGQIIEEKNYESWKKTIEELCEIKQYHEEDLTVYINDKKGLKLKENIQDTIIKVSRAVHDIEKELKEVYKSRQKQYGLEQSNIYIEKFKSQLDKRKKQITDAANVYPATVCIDFFETVGMCIQDCVNDICEEIGTKRYALFLPNRKNLTDNDYRQLSWNNITLNMEKLLKNKSTVNFLCGKDNVNKYVTNIDQEYDYMLISEMEGYPIVLLLCMDVCLKEIGSEEERMLLIKSINDIFSNIFSFAQMAGIEAKSEYFRSYLDSSMSIMRHELGQSNSGYQTLLERFRTSVEYYSRRTFQHNYSPEAEDEFDIFMDNCRNFIRDSKEYLFTTKIRMNSTKYLTEFKPEKKQLFYPYEEFLFKWQQIYYKIVEENNLQFESPHVVLNDWSRPRMNGDPMMIEQAVYNLTNNAMKYAMQGTKVSLDCRLNANKTRYEIIVKNIGTPFKSPDEINTIFAYGRRGSNNEKDGSGLGLYLTRQIALGHGGDVECEMKELSNYNWSLVRLYIDFYEDEKVRNLCKDQVLYEQLKKEWNMKKIEIRGSIVRQIPRTVFTPMYVHQNIRQGTAQFTFKFWIPYSE